MPEGMYDLLEMLIQDRFDAAPGIERPSNEAVRIIFTAIVEFLEECAAAGEDAGDGAGQWKPVPRGFEYLTSLPAGDDGVERYFTISVPDPTSMLNDFWLSVVDYYGRASIPLPENLRLCEWTEQDVDAALAWLNTEGEPVEMQARIAELERLLDEAEARIKEFESILLEWQGTL